jgi:hypothetical protein
MTIGDAMPMLDARQAAASLPQSRHACERRFPIGAATGSKDRFR